MVEPVERQIQVNGVRLSTFEWGERQPETILLVHATGFHARCWDQVVSHLGDSHVIAVDLRGHGRSENIGPYGWDVFGQDVTDLVDALHLDGIVGVGHSMGGHTLIQAAATHQQHFARLVLVDPVIKAPELYTMHAEIADRFKDEVHPVARRRNSFSAPEDMYHHIQGRGPYATWTSEVLRDYCDHGVLPLEGGEGYVLACPPEVESAIYLGSSAVDVYGLVERITLPVTVLRAREPRAPGELRDFSYSPTWPGLASRFTNGVDVHWPDYTHFIPMQAPDLVARQISGETS